ncbi:unnamed protein product [Gadus morhua 'NCC']
MSIRPTVSDSHSLLRAIASGRLRHPPPMRTVTLEGTSVKRATAESAAKSWGGFLVQNSLMKDSVAPPYSNRGPGTTHEKIFLLQ